MKKQMNKKEKKRKLAQQIKNLKDRTRIEIQHTTKAHFGLDGSVMLGKGPVKITVHPDAEISEKMEKNKEASLFKLDPEKQNNHLLQCATTEQLKEFRMPLSEILALPHFGNYAAGEPTDKLYIKNLPKDVTEQDFYWLYGKHFPDQRVMKRDLEIQIMSGRMKGQAFLTFPTVAIAKLALEETNGYYLRTKPIIVAFGKHSSNKEKSKTSDDGNDSAPPHEPEPKPEPELELEPVSEPVPDLTKKRDKSKMDMVTDMFEPEPAIAELGVMEFVSSEPGITEEEDTKFEGDLDWKDEDLFA